MSPAKFGHKLDSKIGSLSENATRWVNRRTALRAAFVGTAAGIGAVSLGQRPALAAPPLCSNGVDCGPTPSCNNQTFCGGGDGGCPANYHLCRSSGQCGPNGTPNEQGWHCIYSAGSWVACTNCSGSGTYILCLDCVGTGGCAEWCTCLSPCL